MTRIFALPLFLVCSTGVFAASEPPHAEGDTLRQYNLNEVVVTATRTPLSVKETPVLTRVITAREIESSGGKNIQQVLETELAGVEFHQAGYGESMTFQGLDARYLLFLVDGERIAGETYGNIDYGRIPLGNIERIEIVRGASSVLYGSSAMGAVVNIITKTPDRPVRIVASGRYGSLYEQNKVSLDGRQLDTRLDIPNIDADLYAGFDFGRLKSQTTLSYIGSDGYMLFSREPEVRHYAGLQNILNPSDVPLTDFVYEAPLDTLGLSISGQRGVNVTQWLDYAIDPCWRIYAKGGCYYKALFAFPESQAGGAKDIYTWESYNSYNVQGGVEFRPNDRNTLTLSYNGDLYRRSMDSLQFFVPKQEHRIQTARGLWIGAFGRNRLTAGLEYTAERLRYDLSRYGYDDRRGLNTASLYAQDELQATERLSFTAGVRLDHSDRFDWHFTPKLSAKYALGRASLRVNYSEGFRTPTLKELYMSFLIPTGAVTVVGNPDLKPEYNRYLSLAAEYLSGFTHLSAAAYTSWFRDKIDVQEAVEGRQTNLVYHNFDKSRFTGVEVMARTRLFPGLFVLANYNYVHQMESGNTASQQYIYPSPHTAAVQLDYRFMAGPREFGIRLSGRYIGEKEYSVAYSAPLRLPDYPGKMFMGAYTATHGDYTLWNLTASAQLTENLSFQAGVENIFDYRAPVIDFNACMSPGRNGFVKLIFTFE